VVAVPLGQAGKPAATDDGEHGLDCGVGRYVVIAHG
jgi:hypothetical protein